MLCHTPPLKGAVDETLQSIAMAYTYLLQLPKDVKQALLWTYPLYKFTSLRTRKSNQTQSFDLGLRLSVT